ncbi:MAG: Flp pilus assembly protein CpaB [Actinobacteria bacterium 13_1_20CM_2_65_11]|nr:MAG: Flp pilus assembly protein CpaB [Chloroflexi bacterium 13_1_40CM_65_17]OLC64374.1 MAG: Flp pilus assembly protein CpaB [Actinobacteria bacterium 13_1_40CM_4_65_12]OLD24416.1 MAG: Flp pilus assembly protein CpaB [Chloroflexi bacterium 13_1_40CM_3_65_12]OLD48591.1 MAG: Flp pilus assembly protein CpaB [Actinobacteria bacterium 13_1_40CM_2_65_8]OLE80456.1 MAG: Flp pilus assembly protein CpaB [Actinobacteria bacterium 13_1_20CM_2_65_11]
MATDGGRSRRGRAYIIGGTILAVAAFLAAAGVASFPYLFQSQSGTNVVVARNEITARTKIQAGDLTLRVINPAPPESFTNISAVAGKGARVDIPAGAAVTANLIATSSDLLSSTDITYLPIPSGYVAVTIPTNEQLGVGGYVQVGDRIAVLASINTSAFGANPGQVAVRTVFKDLYVVRVGPATSEASGPTVTSSLTVIVTACDSEFIDWLLTNAQLKYELESFHDYSTTPTTPDSQCPKLTSAAGVGPKQVDARWHFSAS